jgi:hypothetical protein
VITCTLTTYIIAERDLKATRAHDFTENTILIEERTPVSKAGFRKHRSHTKQVVTITTHIEAGLQRQFKTGAVFVDLTAAYDTIWRDGVMLKFMNAVPCSKLCSLLEAVQPAR